MGTNIQAPRGTHDLYGIDLSIHAGIEGAARQISGAGGFEHIQTPLFEDVSLFVRGLGESSDAVSKELFLVSGPGQREPKWALRPEPTAGIVRAYIQHGWHARPHPQRFWTIGPMFRYDRPQAGRYRQFRQWDVEILGDPGPWTDADVIGTGFQFFAWFGIPLVVHLNSIGDPNCRPRYRAALVEFLQPRISSLSPTSQWRLVSNPLRVLDDRDLPKAIAEAAPRPIDYLCDECALHFAAVQGGLDAIGIPWKLDHRLVRGLDYYTRTTFEFFEVGRTGQQDALGGGGRYDGLVELLGGRPTPGIGFGIGLERTASAIVRNPQEIGSIPPMTVAIIGDGANGAERLAIAQNLRAEIGHEARVLVDGTNRSSKSQLRSMASGTDYAVIVGSDPDHVTVRNVHSRGERVVLRAELSRTIFD